VSGDDLGRGGLLIDGIVVPVPGVTVVGPGPGLELGRDDCQPRGRRPQQVTLHKTIADDPEHVMAGAGPAGGAARTAAYWAQDPAHSGAHLVTGEDGVIGCLADLVRVEGYHATVSNAYAIGIETRERPGGGVYQASLDATVAAVLVICERLGIQLQVPRRYGGHPLKRMADGGSNLIGIFGHRDNTERRGQWDPGDILFDMLRMKGAESFDFDDDEDRRTWKARQVSLNAKGYRLAVDGVPGPATTRALAMEGYRSGIYALGKTPRPA
jgi:hypothetical protein